MLWVITAVGPRRHDRRGQGAWGGWFLRLGQPVPQKEEAGGQENTAGGVRWSHGSRQRRSDSGSLEATLTQSWPLPDPQLVPSHPHLHPCCSCWQDSFCLASHHQLVTTVSHRAMDVRTKKNIKSVLPHP